MPFRLAQHGDHSQRPCSVVATRHARLHECRRQSILAQLNEQRSCLENGVAEVRFVLRAPSRFRQGLLGPLDLRNVGDHHLQRGRLDGQCRIERLLESARIEHGPREVLRHAKTGELLAGELLVLTNRTIQISRGTVPVTLRIELERERVVIDVPMLLLTERNRRTIRCRSTCIVSTRKVGSADEIEREDVREVLPGRDGLWVEFRRAPRLRTRFLAHARFE